MSSSPRKSLVILASPLYPSGRNHTQLALIADSLKINGEAFVWSNAEVKRPATLSTMPAPFHVMLTNEGLVVNKWAGVPSSVSTQ